jgi:type VI secretion system protein ImpJ
VNRVAWYSGLAITQQHFQLQDKYIEATTEKQFSLTNDNSWGLKKIKYDASQLEQGKLLVNICEGIMPDGTPFIIPGSDADHLVLQVSPGTSEKIVYLALPKMLVSGKESAQEYRELKDERYYMDTMNVPDSFEGKEQTEEIQILKPSFRLIIDTKNYQDYTLLPLLKIKSSSPNGTIELDKNFVPPLLSVYANHYLLDFLKQILTTLQQRKKQLIERLSGIDQYGVAGISELMYLQIINKYEPLLKHIESLQLVHPERLYCLWLQLASELQTFTNAERCYPNPPIYNHEDLTKTFTTLTSDLREAFNYIFDEKAKRFKLQFYSGYGLYIATFPDASVFERYPSFVLACKADIPKEQLSLILPKNIKVSSRNDIQNLVNRQLPGIAVKTMPSAPRQIPFHAEYVYFELNTNSELWKNIKSTRTLAICFSKNFAHIDIQLWAIKA